MAAILVLGEVAGDGLESITAEVLAAARKLAETSGNEVAVALAGSGLNAVSADAIALGADRVYLVQDPLLAERNREAQVAAFAQLCERTKPGVVLVGRTVVGRDLAPSLAYRLGVGLAQDCVALATDRDGRLTVTRPVYGGNALAKFTFSDVSPQIASIRPKTIEPLPADASRTGQVEVVDAKLDPSLVRVRIVESGQKSSAGVRMEDAAFVVGGGRGIGGPEGFSTLEELAKLLGGAVGGSRAACDAGWLDHSRQIGLTGKSIAPGVYLAIGISGASQHMSGCSGAKNLVAINKDSEANIFKEASFGVVGDWKKVVPSLLEAVRELVRS